MAFCTMKRLSVDLSDSWSCAGLYTLLVSNKHLKLSMSKIKSLNSSILNPLVS
jgi:hypothetical protein